MDHSQLHSGILSDGEIREAMTKGDLVVEPFDESMIRPSALSLRLGTSAAFLKSFGTVDARDASTYPELVSRSLDESGKLLLKPGEVLLASTLEFIAMGPSLAGILDGISDVARIGVSVVLSHQVSPGFGFPHGAVLTLELISHLEDPILLSPGTRICNMMLLRTGVVQKPYASLPENHSGDRTIVGSLWANYH